MAESDNSSRGVPPTNDGLAAARVAFPQTQEDFEQDPRVSYSRLDSKYILEDDDGSEWEWDESAARWMPSVRSPPRSPAESLSCGILLPTFLPG